MTTLSFPARLPAPARHWHPGALWRRWLAAFEARRRRQADRVILRLVRSDRGHCDADFRLELERRLLGQ
jgi:hypothetical protein